MATLYEGDTIDVDDIYQQSMEYKDNRDEYAQNEGFKFCEDCHNWFENENYLNEHICVS